MNFICVRILSILDEVEKPIILILEDDAIILWHLEVILNALDLNQYKSFESSIQAEQALLSEVFDIVITNLKLKEGWVTEHFLKICENTCPFVIIISGHNSFLSGVPQVSDSFYLLNKPFVANQLKFILRSYQNI